jgi:hypothetical protein
MKIVPSMTFFMCLSVSLIFGDFDPHQFVIGVWGGPILHGSDGLDAHGNYLLNKIDTLAYRGIQNDHYNAINVNITENDLYHSFDGRVGEPSIWVNPVTRGDISNSYRLACLSHFNLKTMVWDKKIGDSPNLFYGPQTICNLKGYYSTTLFAADTLFKQLGRYRRLGDAQKDKILGYFLGDEPNADPQTSRNILKNVDSLHKYEPNRPAIINLLPMNNYCSGFSSEAEYKAYVNTYANHPKVKIICFDIYPFVDNARPPTDRKCWNTYNNNPINGSRVYYFRNYHLFISEKKPGQNFWAVIQGGRPDSGYARFTPNGKSARFCLNSALVYGVQGIWWYCWYASESNHNIFDRPIRDTIAALNRELATMSPVLMGLTWINTVHGRPVDPQSGETALITPDKEITVLAMGPSEDIKYLAIGVFNNEAQKYLMVFNKDLLHTLRNKTIVVNGTNYNPMSFNKTNGSWEELSFTKNNKKKTTSFSVTLPPAEMKLIRLNVE